jgi:hypothetical protein
MPNFHDRAVIPARFAQDGRLPAGASLLLIAGLSALSWGMLAGIAMVVRAVL